jgi:hypothetical protein
VDADLAQRPQVGRLIDLKSWERPKKIAAGAAILYDPGDIGRRSLAPS